MNDQFLQFLQYIATIVSLPVLVALVWKAASKLGALETHIENIRTNELPHLRAELAEMRQDLRRLYEPNQMARDLDDVGL